jgi:hypothetical protein
MKLTSKIAMEVQIVCGVVGALTHRGTAVRV